MFTKCRFFRCKHLRLSWIKFRRDFLVIHAMPNYFLTTRTTTYSKHFSKYFFATRDYFFSEKKTANKRQQHTKTLHFVLKNDKDERLLAGRYLWEKRSNVWQSIGWSENAKVNTISIERTCKIKIEREISSDIFRLADLDNRSFIHVVMKLWFLK